MLEVYEGWGQDKKLVRRIQRESMDVRMTSRYLIWLDLTAESKLILMLYVSPHQLGRLGKYLANSTWQGGIVCPHESQPEGCSIHELDDQAKYRQVLKDIDNHKAETQGYRDKELSGRYYRELNREYHQKQLLSLEVEALALKDSTRFGLVFSFYQAKPEVEIEWLPEDRQLEARKFLGASKQAYNMRERESVPERRTDLTEWKRRLFEV